MEFANTILDTIGNTPLIRLHSVVNGTKATILAKVEYFNPGGSVKDRIGIAMIEEAEKRGLIQPGFTLIEPTSGNTGVGLAIAAAIKGYKVIFVMPDKVSLEKEQLLIAYGAKVIRTPTHVGPDDPRSYYKVTEALVRDTPNSFCLNQYNNQANTLAHYYTTGPEIWEKTQGNITHFVAGMGTGGTITGVGRYLKEKNSEIQIIGVDPEGSLYHHLFYKTKGEIHQYKVEGIGEDFVPKTIDLSVIDKVVVVHDKESITMTRRLALQEGLLVGGSSGAAVVGAIKTAKNLSKKNVVVVLLPDSGKNYLSKIFNDTWMKNNNFL